MSAETSLNAIEVELLRNALSSICDEMYLALMKSAYSTNIKERRDHSAAIFDAHGRVVIQGESQPLHLASMLGLVEVVRERYPLETLVPGDMFVSNDPFVGKGSHLPDVALVMPIFCPTQANGPRELFGFVANIAHHADIGGMSPGGIAGGMSEIYQEGLRIPPIRLLNAGEIVTDVLDLILLNVRVPAERRGDYMAQIASNRLGERRLGELFRRYPPATVRAASSAIIDAVARRMRAAVHDLPNGTYRFKDVMDDDGFTTVNIEIVVEITVDDDHITFDFEGTAPQVKGNINNSWAGLQASVLFALKVLVDPDGPTNHGMLEPVTIKAPEGSIVNAVFPAATAGRSQTCQRIIDVILGALSEAMPQQVIAAGNGANLLIAFSGQVPGGKYYVYMETIGGGAGARAYKDGKDGIQVHTTNTSNLPVEALEREYPLMIERYELVPESGGAGKFRGGMGLRRDYRALGHTVAFSVHGERHTVQPWGLFGGEPGATGYHRVLHDDGRIEKLAAKTATLDAEPSAVVSIVTPGAGGYGNASERAREQVHEDVRSEKYSRTYAHTHYPVQMDTTPDKSDP
jgi:N-methylhydantoinase B